MALLAGAVFWRALGGEFLEWDDHALLVENLEFRGLGWRQLRWMLGTTLLGHWVPVTWLSFAVDYVVWGLDPFGFHLTNLLLHAANVGLVAVLADHLLARATRLAPAHRGLGAVAAALFFGIHPLRVESVAWVTGRRDLLSGLAFLLALLAYLAAASAAGRRRTWWLAGAVAALGAGLLAKAVVMMLPAVLLLLDVYPLRRLPLDPRRWGSPPSRRVLLEKLPFVVLAAAGAAIAYHAEARGANIRTLPHDIWIAKAFLAVWLQLWHTVLPVNLSPFYELPATLGLRSPEVLGAAAGVLGVTVACVAGAGILPAGLAAWLYQAILLAPVTGPVHTGSPLTADRYGYLAGLGWALLVGGGVGWATGAARRGSRPRLATAALALACALGFGGLGVLTWRQTAIWHDTGRLWAHAAAVTPECWLCQVNHANDLRLRGESEAAVAGFARALLLRPDQPGTHVKVALALIDAGRPAEAIRHLEFAIVHLPRDLPTYVGLATALWQVGRARDTMEVLGRTLLARPPSEVAAYLEGRLRGEPRSVVLRLGLAQAYLTLGRGEPARRLRAEIVAEHPELAARLQEWLPPR